MPLGLVPFPTPFLEKIPRMPWDQKFAALEGRLPPAALGVAGGAGGGQGASPGMAGVGGFGLLWTSPAPWARPAPGRVLPVAGWRELTSPACISVMACGILLTDHWRVAHAVGTALPGWLVVVPRVHGEGTALRHENDAVTSPCSGQSGP